MAGDDGHKSGSMDISQHRKNWSGFVKLVEWSLGGIAVLMVFLLIFRTHG